MSLSCASPRLTLRAIALNRDSGTKFCQIPWGREQPRARLVARYSCSSTLGSLLAIRRASVKAASCFGPGRII